MKLLGKKKTPKVDPDTCLGKNIMCEDGKVRRIVELTPSIARRDCFVINENDPDSNMGHFVHTLEITNLALGHKPPTEEQKKSASRLWKRMVLANAKDLYDKHRKGQTLPFDVD